MTLFWVRQGAAGPPVRLPDCPLPPFASRIEAKRKVHKEVLFPGRTVRREPPLNYGEEGTDLNFLKLEETVAPCWVCRLRNAFVVLRSARA